MSGKLRQQVVSCAFSLLAQREYNYHLLSMALIRKSYDSDVVADVLKEFEDKGWLCDSRYATLYARHLIGKGYGPLYVQKAMQAKGVKTQHIQEAVPASNDDQWLDSISSCYKKKYGSSDISCFKKRQKAWAYLSRRGFLSEHIHAMFKKFQAVSG